MCPDTSHRSNIGHLQDQKEMAELCWRNRWLPFTFKPTGLLDKCTWSYCDCLVGCVTLEAAIGTWRMLKKEKQHSWWIYCCPPPTSYPRIRFGENKTKQTIKKQQGNGGNRLFKFFFFVYKMPELNKNSLRITQMIEKFSTTYIES